MSAHAAAQAGPGAAQPAPDTRTVRVNIADVHALSLMELAEVSELSGLELGVMVEQLTAGAVAPALRVLIALAIVLERRRDPGVTWASARRWTVELVEGREGPTRAGRAHRRGTVPAG